MALRAFILSVVIAGAAFSIRTGRWSTASPRSTDGTESG
jgi:hypothetical protein